MPPMRASESMSTRPRRSLPSQPTSAGAIGLMAPPASIHPRRARHSTSSAPLQPPDHAKPPTDRRASLRRESKTATSPAPAASSSNPPAPANGADVPKRASRSSLATAQSSALPPKTPEKSNKARTSIAGHSKPKGAALVGARSPEVKAAVAKARKQQLQAVTAAIARTAENAAEVDAVLGGEILGESDLNGAAENARRKKGGDGKEYMVAGFYCQDANAASPHKLVSKILKRRELEARKNGRRKSGRGKADDILLPGLKDQTLSFPPLPYDHGYKIFFEEEHEFVLPWNIQYEAENGKLDGKKKPMAYSKIRSNLFAERSKYSSDYVAICQCDPSSGCGDNCINRIMNYLCGKDCPSGEACTNKSLSKRKGANVKVVYTGNRGFGLVAMADVNEGDFVIDYRGEVITLQFDYSKSKNFYALAYDADEVIDAGNKGNEARFINHGCDPNLEVRKYQTLGDGQEEFEVGMWAIKDIKAGQELFYDYNFDSFAVRTSNESLRTRCRCGAANCVGFLGRKSGEKSARVIAQELEAKARADAAKSTKRAKKATKAALSRASVKKISAKAISAPKFQPQIKAKDVAKLRASTASASAKRKQEAEAAKAEQRSAALLATMADIVSPLRPKTTRQSNGGFPAPPSTPTAATPTSSSRKRSRATATDTPLTSLSSRRSSGDGSESGDEDDTPNSKKSRNSGWAHWLKKKASEFPRTREQWEQFALQRRRGKVWMEGMMAEFGVAPHEGAPAEPYTPSIPIPAPGQPQRRGPPPGTPRPPRQSTGTSNSNNRRSGAVEPATFVESFSGHHSAHSSVGPSSPAGFIAHQLNGAKAQLTLPSIATLLPNGIGIGQFPFQNPEPSLLTHLKGNGPTPQYGGSTRSRRSMGTMPQPEMLNVHTAIALQTPNGTLPMVDPARTTRRTRSSLPNGH